MSSLQRFRQFASPLALALLPLTFAGPAAGQSGKPDRSDRFEGSSQVVAVEVPVNVVGRDGQPVRGLTAEAFEVFDGGEKQTITGFEVIDLAAQEPEKAASSIARLEELGSSARRHFLFLFDLTFSDPTSILRARLAARDFLLNKLHPSDLAAVATYSLETGPKLVVTFTPDRAQLARAVDTLGMRRSLMADKTDPLRFLIDDDVTGFSATSASVAGGGDTEGIKSQRDQMIYEYLQGISNAADRTERSFEVSRLSGYTRALAEMARSLNAIKGRKQVVFFSEGFDSRLLVGRETTDAESDTDNANIASGRTWLVDNDMRYGNTGLQSDVNRMLEEFRRADCVIQAVDVGGLRGGVDATGRRATSGEEALFYLANETGGELFKDANNLGDQLARLLTRTSVTYLLTFERSDLKTDGAYRRLRVKAKLPQGARLSHRAGYYAPRPFKELAPLEKNLLASDSIATATPRRDLGMSVLLAPFRSTPQKAYVPVILEIAGRALLEGQKDDKLNVEIYAYASDSQHQMRDFFTQRVGLDLGKSRKAFEESGLKYYGHLDLAPGSYLVRVLVRNAQNGRTAVESVRVEVPSYDQAQPVLLPPFFMEQGSKWLLVRETSEEAGQQGSVVYPFTIAGEPYVPSAKPVLRSEGKARLCLVAYNLGQGDLSLQGKVLAADGTTSPGGRLAMVERTTTGINGLDKVLATFDASGLNAGNYVLQVAVTDPRTGHKEMNSLPFQVIN